MSALRYLDGVVPAADPPTKDIRHEVDAVVDRFRFREALAPIWRVVEDANRYVVETKPWELARTSDPRLPTVLGIAVCVHPPRGGRA